MPAKSVSFATLKNPVHFLALGLGTGCSPWMPGTCGTLIGILLFWFLHGLGLWLYMCITAALLLAGIWLCDRTARNLGVPDHPAIVWDEIVGYLVTMIAVPAQWPWMLAGFLLFRFFDIVKPWPVSWADKKVRGGLGIMLDDVIAGLYGLVILQIFLYML